MVKKILSLILIVLLLPIVYANIPGDADGDGYVSPLDKNIIRNIIGGGTSICYDDTTGAVINCEDVLDFDGDGIDEGDLEVLNNIVNNQNVILGDADGDGYPLVH